MCEIFKTNIHENIRRKTKEKISLIGTPLPSNQDIYFLSKWDEIYDRYCSARLFIMKTFENNWDYWFEPTKDEENQKGMEYIVKSYLYEAALVNYNIIVDLSWTITYVSCECMSYKFDSNNNIINATEISGMMPIEEAYKLLRKTEKGVQKPTSDGNPFDYIKKMAPEFSHVIDLIIDFWKSFSQSNIRSIYNYIKHRGKPVYTEIEDIKRFKLFSLNINGNKYPTAIRDVQKELVLEDEIKNLTYFDDNILFPYIEKLLKSLNNIIEPSPWIL